MDHIRPRSKKGLCTLTWHDIALNKSIPGVRTQAGMAPRNPEHPSVLAALPSPLGPTGDRLTNTTLSKLVAQRKFKLLRDHVTVAVTVQQILGPGVWLRFGEFLFCLLQSMYCAVETFQKKI